MTLRIAALSLFLLAACKDKPDLQKVFADLEAVNARACACKDEACLTAASGDYAKIVSPVIAGNKDKETAAKLGELQTKHDNCATKLMGGINHK